MVSYIYKHLEAYLEPCQTSMLDFFFAKLVNSFLTFNYFRKEAPAQMFKSILITPLSNQ